MVQVFVTHQRTGVHPIPEEWLDGYSASGFRYATAIEVAWWYEEHGLPIPPDVEMAAQAQTSETDAPMDSTPNEATQSRWYASLAPAITYR